MRLKVFGPLALLIRVTSFQPELMLESSGREPRASGLAGLKISPSSRVVLYLGRMHPSKGPDLLVEAFIKIAREVPDAHLVLAGPDEHGMLATLAARLSENGLTGRCDFPGMVGGEEKIDLLARADVLALPSIAEGLSNAALEALASGTPLLVSEGCNMPVVGEAGAGLVVERTSEAFAAGLSYFLTDDTRAAVHKENAYRLAVEHYSWDPILQTLEGPTDCRLVLSKCVPPASSGFSKDLDGYCGRHNIIRRRCMDYRFSNGSKSCDI